MKGRCMLLAAVAVAVAATFATPSSAQADRAGAPVVVAAVPVSMAFGTNIVAPRWEVRLDTCANPPPCPVDVDFTVGEIQSGSAGAILWADQSSAGFRTLTAYLTDGTSNLLGWGVLAPISPSFAVGTESFTTESMFLNSDPSGSDLQGWSLSRIGFAVEAATIDSPGQDLNHDGIWTDVNVSGKFLFEALLFDHKDCMDDQWRTLRRPDLSPFRNLGECISYVVGVPSE